MKARYAWTLAAAGLVVAFFATRAYVGQAIEAEFDRPVEGDTQVVKTPRKKPKKPKTSRPPADPLGNARPHVDALRDASRTAEPTAETWEAGAAALDALLALELDDWTPRTHVRVLDQLTEAAEDLQETGSPEATALREKVEKAYIQLRTTPVEGTEALDLPPSIPDRFAGLPSED